MKKMFLSLILMSSSAFAAPCWIVINGVTVNADSITKVEKSYDGSYVAVYFGEEWITVNTKGNASADKWIAGLVHLTRTTCK